MSHEFDLLLKTFIGSDGVDEEHMIHNMQEYFKVKTVIYEEVGWLERHRVASYVLMYFQFLQMVLYFNAHPRAWVVLEHNFHVHARRSKQYGVEAMT